MIRSKTSKLFTNYPQEKYLTLVILGYLVVHGLLFFYDMNHANAFLEGDRAVQRLKSINNVLASLENPTALMDTLIINGVPGDYIFHFLAYTIYQSYSVIFLQIIIGLIAIIYLCKLTDLLFHEPILSILASFAYLMLPGTLVHPHTLVTESLYNPLLLISFYYSIKYLFEDNLNNLVIAGVSASLASFIRLIFVLYPLVFVFIILMPPNIRRVKAAITYLALAFSIPLIWMGMNFAHNGQFAMGGSRLPRNFYLRVERMTVYEPIPLELNENGVKEMSADSFLHIILDHPVSFIKTLRSDVYNIGLNTGINTFAGRYLNLYLMPESTRYWRNVRDSGGLSGSIVELLNWSPLLIIVNLLASILWLFFVFFSLYGFWLFVKIRNLSIQVKLTFIIFPIYIICTQFAASTPRWSHRTPAEFIFAIMFALGIANLGRLLKNQPVKFAI